MLHPSKVGVATGWHTILPSHITCERWLPPIREVERRVCHNVVGFERWVLVVEESVGIRFAQVGFKSTDSDVHVRHLPSGWVSLLAIDADATQIPLMAADEFGTLHKHATRPAARVVNTPLVGLENLHDGAHNAAWRVEFAGVLALHRGKLLKAIFIGAAQQVFLVGRRVHLNVGKQVHHIAKAALVEFGAREILGQNALQARVFLLNGKHGIVDSGAHLWRVGSSRNHAPSRIFRHEKHIVGGVFVLVLLVGIFVGREFAEFLFKFIRNIFKENKSQNHALVFRGIEVATEHIGSFPNLIFKSNRSGIFLRHNSVVSY